MKSLEQSTKPTIESVFKAAPIGIGVVSQRVITAANQHLCEITGYTCEELIGQNSRLLYATDEEYEYVGSEKYAQIAKLGIGSVETIIRRKDGSLMDALLKSTPINPHDLKSGVTFTMMDISHQKNAEKLRQEYIFFLDKLREITNSALQCLTMDEMMLTLSNQMGELVGADGCYLTLWDESTQTIVPIAAYGHLNETYTQVVMHSEETTMTRSVLDAGHALVAEDVHHSPYITPRVASLFPTKSMLGLPLIAGCKKLGAILISFNQPHTFTQQEIVYGEMAAAQIALAIEKTRLFELAKNQAVALENKVEQQSNDLDIVMGSTVAREVRMAELKKVIRQLRAQLLAAGMTPAADDPLNSNNPTLA